MSNPNFCRGANPTSIHKVMAAKPFQSRLNAQPPSQFAMLPPKERLNNYGNDSNGDCVSAEECYAKVAFAFRCGLNLTIARSKCIQWASQHGVLNGADLQDVLRWMARDGISADDNVNYKDGPFTRVSYGDEAILQAALFEGPVKLGIDANGLPSGAGSQQGWWSTSGNHHNNEDHSVTLDGYGPASFIFDALKLPLPAGLSGSTPGYGLFTWGTIGFVTHDWVMGCTQEAYLRSPTTIGQSPTPPVPVGVPPFKLFEGSMGGDAHQVGVVDGYADAALARLQAQGFADADHVPVMIHDSTGAMIETVRPTPPKPLTFSVVIPPQNVTVQGRLGPLFGSTAGVTVTGEIHNPAAAAALPPWLAKAIQLACKAAPMLPPPYNAIAAGVCSLLPPASAEQPCDCD